MILSLIVSTSQRRRLQIALVVAKRCEFLLQTPVLLSMSPLKGPLAGGTAVTLVGEQLDIGTNATVTMGDNLCPVIR